MHNKNNRKNATKLGVEFLEDRTVPATFGAKQGESVAVGDVIPGNDQNPGGTNYEFVTGSGPGKPGIVNVYDANGILKYHVTPFADYTGGVNVAIGEVTGERGSVAGVTSASMAASGVVTIGTSIAHGYTVGQTVSIQGTEAIDLATGNVLYVYDGRFTITAVPNAYTFKYNVFPPNPLPPAANIVGDAGVFQKDLICSTAAGSTGRVRVYSFQGNQLRSMSLFMPFGPNYVGGIQVTTGDVNGDYTKEIIVGQQTNGSTVKVFNVDPNSSGHTYFETRKFKAFEVGYKGGVTLASANIDATENDGVYNYDDSEIIVGKAKEAPLLKIFDAQLPTVTLRAQYFAFDPNINDSSKLGINVAAGSTDGLRGAEIYVSQQDTTNKVRILNGQTGVAIGDFSVGYPVGFGRNLDIAVNDLDDVLAPGSINTSYPFLFTDIFVVASDGPYNQVPIVFPGQYFSPAGLNGSRAAP